MKVAATLVGTAIVMGLAPAAVAAPLEARASLRPATAFFGDPVTAEIEVVVDESVVDPSSVRIDFAAAPYRRLSSHESDRASAGSVTVIRERVRVVCASAACLPREQPRQSAPPPVRISARNRESRPLAIRVDWTPVRVAARVPPRALGGEPSWQVDDAPSAPSYRASPDLLYTGLAGLALGLALVAAVLVGNEVVRMRRRRARAHLSPLEAALAAVRAAMNRDEGERRTAAGALARALAPSDGRLLAMASELAWSEQPPAPHRLVAFAEEVEQEVGAR
jgi:hypothetical protein